jgi:isopentenyl-diphosphate Delta-isomerase
MKEYVILVDESDTEIGTAEKLQTHREGALHRAFSIFVFNPKDELLLQKRAKTKYHSGGLWSNTCCSHPRPAEPIHAAAHRRLMEEMGFGCDLEEIFSFTYRVQFADDLFEHEYDHVFVGTYDGEPAPNPAEVNAWKWMDLDVLRQDVRRYPDRYTYWLKLCVEKMDPRIGRSGAFQELPRAGERAA